MLERYRTRIFTGALAIGFQVLLASNALAHHPTITAAATCSAAGTAVINYTSTSWSPNAGEGENSQIDIRLNGVTVYSGAYVFPGNSFSGTLAAPAGTTATVSAVAIASWGDGAGGLQSASTTVTIPTDCLNQGDGRFTGGGSQIRVDGVRVTRGLTIHCDLKLSNNLEVNWQGNQFHMEEHLTTTSCTDDPGITQAPPAAPLDTLIGVGRGRYNGEDGFTIEFTLVDYGEPGTADQMAIKIYKGANVVLDVPLQVLTGGNLQAHYDQPHK
jgi:hypothetical protein